MRDLEERVKNSGDKLNKVEQYDDPAYLIIFFFNFTCFGLIFHFIFSDSDL
jgi:hypothetical protein